MTEHLCLRVLDTMNILDALNRVIETHAGMNLVFGDDRVIYKHM